MATPPIPTQTTPMMQQAQQAMNNPMGAPVNPSGGIDPSVHPIVGQIVRALQAAATGYGWSAMSPQEREQRTALQQQKAEALGRQAIAQQQLGLESQRVGIEAGRAGEEVRHHGVEETLGGRAAATRETEAATAAAGQKATEKYQTGELAARQAQLDQEKELRGKELKQQADQLEELTRFHKQQGTLEGQRNSIMAQDAKTAADRVDMEERHYNQQMQIQGQQLSRQTVDEQRKIAHSALDSYYKEHPYLAMLQTETGIANMHQGIDDYYDIKLKEGADVGTAKPNLPPGKNVGPMPGPGDVAQGKHAYKLNNQWFDATTNQPIGRLGAQETTR